MTKTIKKSEKSITQLSQLKDEIGFIRMFFRENLGLDVMVQLELAEQHIDRALESAKARPDVWEEI